MSKEKKNFKIKINRDVGVVTIYRIYKLLQMRNKLWVADALY